LYEGSWKATMLVYKEIGPSLVALVNGEMYLKCF